MPTSTKPDAARILAKLVELRHKYRRDARYWWASFVFHYATLQNAVSILKTGCVYSRLEAQARNLLQEDSASASVLSHTLNKYKNCVRLYFRPKTPTQYSNEGIRPDRDRVHGSHCPIPVFLLFDSKDLLTRRTTMFSDGSLAGHSPGTVSSTAKFFCELPFDKIYHNSWLQDDQKRDIITARHAEVIVPEQLDLGALRFIWCRSEAEKETLLSHLDEPLFSRWGSKIFHGPKYDLFFRRWSYVDRVTLGNKSAVINFNRSTKSPGPFSIAVSLVLPNTDRTPSYTNSEYLANGKLSLRFPEEYSSYTIQLQLDGGLAYRYVYEDFPELL